MRPFRLLKIKAPMLCCMTTKVWDLCARYVQYREGLGLGPRAYSCTFRRMAQAFKILNIRSSGSLSFGHFSGVGKGQNAFLFLG